MAQPGTPSTVPQLDGGSVDLFLSYNRSDQQQVEAIRASLERRGVRTFLDRANLAPGMPWADALQDAIRRAHAVAVFLGASGLGSWQKREMVLALDRQAEEERRGRSFAVVPVLLPGVELDAPPGFLVLNTWVDLRRGIEGRGGLDALVRASGGPAPSAGEVATSVPPALCPYVGLRAFREEDAPLYFGREIHANRLLETLDRQSLVAVVAASGSGKSSLVQAGLLPLLRRRVPPQPTWDAITFTPGARPFHQLAAALVRRWSVDASETTRLLEAERLGTALADRTVPIASAVAETLRHLASDRTDRLLLVVDQFEELFTLTTDAGIRRGFVDGLLGLAQSSGTRVLLTLRADYYGLVIGLSRELSDRTQQGQVNLGPLLRDELREVIRGPADVVGLRFDDGLVERILGDVEEQPGSLPLLEFALTELWSRREGQRLTHAAYNTIGEVEGAIGRRADDELSRWTPAEQERLIDALTRLVHVATAQEEGTDTRRRVHLDELDGSVRQMVGALVDARLLVTNRDEATGRETVEVAHEALIRTWRRLRDRLDEDRAFLVWRQRLEPRLSEWREAERSAELLLKGRPLAEACRWRRLRQRELNEAEHHFISQSERAVHGRRTLRRSVASVAALAIVALAASFWYSRTDGHQVRRVLANGPAAAAEVVADRQVGAEAHEGYAVAWYEALIGGGHFDAARTTISSYRDPEDRAEAFTVVQELLGAEHASEASRVAEAALTAAGTVEDPYRRARLLSRLARVLAGRGREGPASSAARDAVAAARSITDSLEAVANLVAVADTLAAAGLTQPAREAAHAAAGVARSIGRPGARARARALAALALGAAGETQEALDHAWEVLAEARALSSGFEAAWARQGAAQAVGIWGRPADADSAFRLTPDPYERVQVMEGVARALADAGRLDDALSIARAAAAIASSASASRDREMLLVRAGYALASAGATEEAVTIWKAISAIDLRVQQLTNLATALTEKGMRPAATEVLLEALAAARLMADPEQRSQQLGAIAVLSTQSGQHPLAMAAAREIIAAGRAMDDPSTAMQELAFQAEMLVEAGNAEAARELVETSVALSDGVRDPDDRIEGLANAASVLASAGRPVEGIRMAMEAARRAGEISSVDRRGAVLWSAAQAAAAAGMLRQARQLADAREVTPYGRLDVYTRILVEHQRRRTPGTSPAASRRREQR